MLQKAKHTGKKPSIGRIVHYSIEENVVRPAIITTVHDDDSVNLIVFMDAMDESPSGLLAPVTNVPHYDIPQIGMWNWPEMV